MIREYDSDIADLIRSTLSLSDEAAAVILAPHGLERHCALSDADLAVIYSNQEVNSAGYNHRVVWTLDQLREYIRRCCSRCLVTGIHQSILPLTIDRRIDDLDYEESSVICMGQSWNYAKATILFLKSTAAFVENKGADDRDDTEIVIQVIRGYVEMFIAHQRR